MKRFFVLLLMIALFLSAAGGLSVAEPGKEDLSMLTYQQLLAVQADVSKVYSTYHTPTDAQKEFVLNLAKNEAQKHFAEKGLSVTGWAWYDSEYTYTKDWDFYTLQTHLDYRDSQKKSHQAKIYCEAYYQNGKFTLSYLTSNGTAVLDHRADYQGILWFTEPQPAINQETGIDLSRYTAKELTALYNRAERQIEATHSVSQEEQNTIMGYTKLELEQYLLEKDMELRGYAWYDSEYTYIRDWDYYWLETHVDYRTSSGSSKTDKLFSEFARISGDLQLVFLKMGSTVIVDRKNELAVVSENGIPRYSWAGEPGARTVSETAEPTGEPVAVETSESGAEEPAAPVSGENIINENGIWLSFSSASDEDLEAAVQMIHRQQRARLTTKIVLSEETVTVAKGKQVKLTAEVVDVPEDQKASHIIWTSSDAAVASCQNGSVSGKSNGQAIITASCTLSDGTEISVECAVTVYTPVTALQAGKKQYDLGVGESVTAEVSVQPKDASNPALRWESSDPSVASVSAAGVITGEGTGTAVITAHTVDGSEKQASFTVKSSKKDDLGRTISNSDGVALTILSMKQTKGSGYSKAENGNIFVLIEMQIENNSSREVAVNGVFSFDAICDDYSVDYSFTADMNTKSEIPTTELKPGKKIKGWKGFELPANWKELQVTFTPDVSFWGSGEKIEFVLYNK